MNKDKIKLSVTIDYEYVMGYLKYGHDEGIIEIPREDYEKFKKDPQLYLEENDEYRDGLNFVLDGYEINDIGGISEVYYGEVVWVA